MYINQSDLLIYDMTDEQCDEVYKIAKDIMLIGKLPDPMPSWLYSWYYASGSGWHNKLMVFATVLPQRLLLSVIKHMENKK